MSVLHVRSMLDTLAPTVAKALTATADTQQQLVSVTYQYLSKFLEAGEAAGMTLVVPLQLQEVLQQLMPVGLVTGEAEEGGEIMCSLDD